MQSESTRPLVPCKRCGALFVSLRNAAYCSTLCRVSQWKAAHAKSGDGGQIRQCPSCGQSFKRRAHVREVYCSRPCRDVGQYVGEILSLVEGRQCRTCGQWFIVGGPHRGKWTCNSHECRKSEGRRRYRETFVSVRQTNPTVEKACAHCGKIFKTNFVATRRIYCSERCTKRAAHSDKRHRVRYWKRRSQRLATVKRESIKRLEVWKRDNKKCRLCGKPINFKLKWPDAKSFTIDHIVPISKGGAHVMTNVQSAHLICNSLRREVGSGQPFLF